MASTEHAGEDVDMTLVDDFQTLLPADPPARVAARFVRRSSARRRSSAQSSRCSSLSSRHSRSSTLSCHGGPRSTHIAQHLRRASIIESRKARLADRAAHAEKVRLRAAAAKAVQRPSNSEEKALAAQAAREKLLAEITARCEEEVRRAKKVAEETRAKKEEEYARRRDEMEEKFAEAAKRRTVYQSTLRRSRTTSLAAVEEKKINPVVLKKIGQTAAAKVIQRTWRAWLHRKPAVNYLKLGLDLTQFEAQSFEDATRLIAEDPAINSALAVLRQWELVETSSLETSQRGAARVFLSAYLILSHPVQTFSHGGSDTREQDLISKARLLLDAFQSRVTTQANTRRRLVTPLKAQEHLKFLFNDFNAAFHLWKSKDLSVLVDVMVRAFVNLDLIIQSTKGDTSSHVADDYLQAVRLEQVKLLARLKRLAGPDEALSKIRMAVVKARKEKASKQKRSSQNNVPRGSSDNENMLDGPVTEPLTPPATPPAAQRPAVQGHPSSYVNRLGRTMTVLPSNRVIAHEMQVNGFFELEQQPWTDSRKEFMDALRDSMRESTQMGGVSVASDWTHAMAVLIRDKLLKLVSRKHPLHDRIENFLDPELIGQQARNNVFSYSDFFVTISDIIAQICSPGRDEAVRSFRTDTNGDTIDRLLTLINIIDLMSLDHINFQFRMATRSVVEQGHEHESEIFEQSLREGEHTLDHTRQWWTDARATLAGVSAGTVPYENSVYARGLADLVLSNKPLEYSSVPETLRLDWTRLLNLRARVFQMTTVSSILLTTKIRLRRNREALWQKDAKRLMSLDLMHSDAQRVVSLVETSHMMPDSTREGLLNFVSRVLPSAIGAAEKANIFEQSQRNAIYEQCTWDPATVRVSGEDVFTEQVATFILKSLREHVFSRLAAASTAERVRTTTAASEVLARAGMPEFVTEVNDLIDVMERIKNVDLKAHGQWYDEVASTVASTSAV